MSTRAKRIKFISDLENTRKSKVISYICSTRQGASYEMDQVDIRYLYDHLAAIGKTEKIDLIVNSFGGDVTVPWRLVNLIRQFTKEFNVIIPYYAFSSATLTAMGADSIVMLPAATLGPTDPSSNGLFNPLEGNNRLPINVEDLTSYIDFIKEDFEIKSEVALLDSLKILSQSDSRIHPIALGAAKRGSKLARKYATDLLSVHMKGDEKEKINKIVKTFSADFYYHSHPINRDEAKAHELKIAQESEENEKIIWDLYLEYENLMNLNDIFDYISEFKKIQPTVPLSSGNTAQPITKTLPEVNLAVIESLKFTNIHQRGYDVTGLHYIDAAGNLREVYSWILKSVKWAVQS